MNSGGDSQGRRRMWVAEVVKCGLVLVAMSSVCAVEVSKVPSGKLAQSCQPDKLTVYKVILHTFWTRDKFPKHYPDWRPPAQWSKLIGRSHDSSFELFRLGKKASKGVKTFAETGRTDILEEQSQGEDGVYDEFTASAIPTGSGRTESEFFVDGNHSRVSIMSRIVPSPDWFIGIDGFDLCVEGSWVDSITIDADPIDAGTDNGFTFTAPNWPTDPQGVIYKVTSRYPSHPAGSFYYPYLKKLPPIATFQFIKIKEYELSEVFHHSEDRDHFEIVKADSLPRNEIPEATRNSDLQEEIEEERKEEEMRVFRTTEKTSPTVSATTIQPPSASTSSPGLFHGSDVVERGDKDAILKNIVQIYKNEHHKHNKLKKSMRKLREYAERVKGGTKAKSPNPNLVPGPPRDCKVSEWSEWGSCSKSCGIGEMERRREVTKHARRGGRVCPPLLETKWCGSSRACPKSYFNW